MEKKETDKKPTEKKKAEAAEKAEKSKADGDKVEEAVQEGYDCPLILHSQRLKLNCCLGNRKSRSAVVVLLRKIRLRPPKQRE